MRKVLVALWLVPLILSGCATHDPNQVRIEDRSLEGAAPVPASTRQIPAKISIQNSDESKVEDLNRRQPAVGNNAPAAVIEPSRPAYQPPASTVAPSEPSGALLALLEQAEQQHQAGRNQQALSSLERAQRIAPRDPLVYLQLARLRLDMNDHPRAEQLARKGLNLSSGNPQMQKAFKALLQRIK
ncbi:MAG: tetratricopeptide repeat protein [Motiliproteus sp.]